MTRPDEDLVLRARVRLLGHNSWFLEGEEGLRVYRALFAVSPRAYAHKLVLTLSGAAHAMRLAGLPQARPALLWEAAAVVEAVPWMRRPDPAHPYRASMVESMLRRLAELEQQPEQRPGQEGHVGVHGESQCPGHGVRTA